MLFSIRKNTLNWFSVYCVYLMTPSLQNPDMNRTIISKSFGELMNIHELLRKWYDQRSYFLLHYKVHKVQLCIQRTMQWINDFWILTLSGVQLSLTFQTFLLINIFLRRSKQLWNFFQIQVYYFLKSKFTSFDFFQA